MAIGRRASANGTSSRASTGSAWGLQEEEVECHRVSHTGPKLVRTCLECKKGLSVWDLKPFAITVVKIFEVLEDIQVKSALWWPLMVIV